MYYESEEYILGWTDQLTNGQLGVQFPDSDLSLPDGFLAMPTTSMVKEGQRLPDHDDLEVYRLLDEELTNGFDGFEVDLLDDLDLLDALSPSIETNSFDIGSFLNQEPVLQESASIHNSFPGPVEGFGSIYTTPSSGLVVPDELEENWNGLDDGHHGFGLCLSDQSWSVGCHGSEPILIESVPSSLPLNPNPSSEVPLLLGQTWIVEGSQFASSSPIQNVGIVCGIQATPIQSPLSTPRELSPSSSPRPSEDSGYESPTSGRIYPQPAGKSLPSARVEPYPGIRPERRERKKEQNKTAALKYRQKKRSEQGVFVSECDELEKRNSELKGRVTELTREIDYLKGLIAEIYSAE